LNTINQNCHIKTRQLKMSRASERTSLLSNRSWTGHDDDEENDRNVVWWDGDDDPENPMNWSERKRWSQVAIISFLTFLM
jgi:hypothetical protein